MSVPAQCPSTPLCLNVATPLSSQLRAGLLQAAPVVPAHILSGCDIHVGSVSSAFLLPSWWPHSCGVPSCTELG